LVDSDLIERPERRSRQKISPTTAPDQVVPDDLIVDGKGCIGLGCGNNEAFGPEALLIKQSVVRLRFEDTSAQAGFPARDWQLTANDSASGGANKFSIEDITGAKVPFTVTAGAATNSVFVDSTGRVGFRTSTPVLDLHVSTSNTPGMRLEQNNSGGFTAQTWDIAGNEANFFVRDVTGGSRLPFRIRPGAPTSSIDISADGDVGIGTASPDVKLHVESSGAGSTDGKVLIENTNVTVVSREALELQNDGGPVVMIFKDSTAAARWVNGTSGENFLMNNQANAGVEFTLTGTGSLTIAGTLTQGSSRDTKTDIAALDPQDVLSRVSNLPVALWSYKTENGVRHFGPMAEDFHQAFGLGEDDKHIAPGDAAGIALAAVQGLNKVVQEKDKEIGDLRQRNTDLEKRLADLEALVANLAAPKQ
ncbi:MAG TPA: tail fiber domain-containing protein, partial [Thermoanaerobaculia bacterium]|nr:tail fiber domain-containing protein [Thermoanaerobaculia bacterium]